MVAGVILLAPLLLLMGVAYRYGAFEAIDFREQAMGPYLVSYRSFTGSYTLSNSRLTDIYNDLTHNHEVTVLKGFGVFYDKPGTASPEKMRYDLGVVLETKDETILKKLKSTYQIKEMPVQLSIVATFPYVGDGSPLLGALKVYPRLEEYAKENGVTMKPVMELYDLADGIIYYILAK
jgi:hypothetical protein